MRTLFPCALCLAALLAAGGARAADAPTAPVNAEDVLKRADLLVSIEAPDIPLDEALRMISKQFGLSIITARDVSTSVKASFKNVTLAEALDSLVTINGFAYRAKGAIIEVYLPRPPQPVIVVEQPRVETFILKYANAEKTKNLLKTFITKDAGKMEADISGNALLVYDVPSVLETIRKVIEKVDAPEPQVAISAEIIEASVSVSERLGVDWQTRVSASGAARPITFPFSARKSDSRWVPGNNVTGDEFGAGESFPFPSVDDFKFGTLDASGLKAVLEILKSDTGTNLVANPEITTLNNREAKINIGDTVPIPTYTTNLETGVTAVTGFQNIDTGTILVVTPQVNEGRTITLTVKPEISQITGYKGQFDERPVISLRKAETTVRLNDGETLVIGGLVNEHTTEVTRKIPILGDAPLFGWFFRYQSSEKEKSSLYIFITPRVLNDERSRERARKAGDRLFKLGLTQTDTNSDDLRDPAASPFK